MSAAIDQCDVLIVGSGAAGLTAALTALAAGMDVCVVEKAPVVGGTTALSEGMIWIPLSRQAREAGVTDDRGSALNYLRAVADNYLDANRAEAFLDAAPRMLESIEALTPVRYTLAGSLDYFPKAAGATRGARSLRVEPIDGRMLGKNFSMIRPPLKTMMAFGGMTITSVDHGHAMKARRSWRSLWHMGRLATGYVIDRLSGYERGLRLGNGNALVAGITYALLKGGVRILTNTTLLGLETDGTQTVTGARLSGPEGELLIRTHYGVILATGGFPGNRDIRTRLYPHQRRGQDHYPLAPHSNSGDGLIAATQVGARFDDDVLEPAAWVPVSLIHQRDGSIVPFPHFIDRCKPGFVVVDRRGLRFASESMNYHQFVPKLFKACRDDKEVVAFLIGDSRAVAQYGIGPYPPFPGFVGRAASRGQIKRALRLQDLGDELGVDAVGLENTINRFNTFAQNGVDMDFGRGEDAYERASGDQSRELNPCLGLIDQAPFYGLPLRTSDLGSLAGLATDASARVLNSKGQPIAGLYAAGNDTRSAFGGFYPAAGVTIGLAMTFGFIAAEHIAARCRSNPVSATNYDNIVESGRQTSKGP